MAYKSSYNSLPEVDSILSELASDTIKGLSSDPKYLLSKNFYDDKGSSIFQKITRMPEYYLTNCEKEIFEVNHERIASHFIDGKLPFDLIELGSGDGFKTRILLKTLVMRKADFNFVPVDINHKINNELASSLKADFPLLNVKPVHANYFQLINSSASSGRRKIILFLGSNIGNFDDEELLIFMCNLKEFCSTGDQVLLGFDLKKSPGVIMKAYDDPYGLTRKFNLNHLARLNRELNTDFDLRNFEHHTEYDPLTGYVKSFLVSTEDQEVNLGLTSDIFYFRKWEPLFMELSRKFEISGIASMASSNGFRVEVNFTDKRNYFVNSLWEKI